MSLATSVLLLGRRGHRRCRSADEILLGETRGRVRVDGFGIGGNIFSPPYATVPGNGLDIDQKRLVLRRLDVGVADIRRQHVRAEAFLRRSGEAPVERYADDMDGLAVAGQRPDPLGHDRLRGDRAALRPDAHPAALGDALFRRELFRDLHEEFRLHHGIHVRVRGPEVEMLGQPIGGRRIREFRRSRLGELLPVALEHPRRRIADDLGRDRVGDRAFERLVMRREWPVAHHANEEARDAFRVHDERADLARLGRRRDVRDVVARPFRAVPFDQLAGRIPGLSVEVAGGPVVEDAAVGRPRERPFRISAGFVRIGRVPAGHVVAVLVEAAGIDPAAASGRTVVPQRGEARQQLSGLDQHFLGSVVSITSERPCR